MEKPLNSLSFLYTLAQSKKDEAFIWAYNAVKRHLKFERNKILEKMCRATDTVALSAHLISEYKRKNHVSHGKVLMNGKTYYITDRNNAFYRFNVATEQGKYIYE